MQVTRRSIATGIERTKDLPITDDQIKAWQEGSLIQNAFPHLSASDREFIMTGMTDEEWEDFVPNF